MLIVINNNSKKKKFHFPKVMLDAFMLAAFMLSELPFQSQALFQKSTLAGDQGRA